MTEFLAVLLLMVLALCAWQWWTPPASTLCPLSVPILFIAMSLSISLPLLLFLSVTLCASSSSGICLTQLYSLTENSLSVTPLFSHTPNLIFKKANLEAQDVSFISSIDKDIIFISVSKWIFHPFPAFDTTDNEDIKLSDGLYVTL